MTVTIFENEVGLFFVHGKFVQELGPGRHRWWKLGTRVEKFDTRTLSFSVGGQEVAVSDGATVRASIEAEIRLKDAHKAFSSHSSPQIHIYTALQVALRDTVSTMTLQEVFAARSTLGDAIKSRASGAAESVGYLLETVHLKDIVAGGELKRALAEALKIRILGEAALERARTEHAAMRSLANTAKMIEDNPKLLQLRLIQVLEQGKVPVSLGVDSFVDR